VAWTELDRRAAEAAEPQGAEVVAAEADRAGQAREEARTKA